MEFQFSTSCDSSPGVCVCMCVSWGGIVSGPWCIPVCSLVSYGSDSTAQRDL